MSFVLAALLLAITTSVTCALPGTFLVLRRQSMLVDAMSHAVLPGIVLGALLSGSTYSPIMVVLAAGFGLIVVLGANYLQSTGLLPKDASQGVIFPLLFSGGVIFTVHCAGACTYLRGYGTDRRPEPAGFRYRKVDNQQL